MTDNDKLEILQGRAKLYNVVRSFFLSTNALEVETPQLSEFTTTEPFIDSFDVLADNKRLFLHTSPEFYMKRLLSEIHQDVFQLSKVFRREELGNLHLREFSLLEWYRININEQQLIDDVISLIQSIWQQFNANKSPLPIEKISYFEFFETSFNINPHRVTIDELKTCAKRSSLLSLEDVLGDEKDRWFDALMSCSLDANLGGTKSQPKLTFLYDYPKSQCALARIGRDVHGNEVAKRFELYIAGVELANGFYELNSDIEQRQRFIQENNYRQKIDKETIPLDEEFLNDLAKLPECSGVALGLDRLLMLLLEKDNIHDVVSFSQ